MSVSAKMFPIRPRHCKPRQPSGFTARLGPNRRKTLFAWLTKDGGVTYAQARERIWRLWHIKTNDNQLSAFWQSYCQPRLIKPAPTGLPVIQIGTGKIIGQFILQVRRQKP